MLDLAKHGLQGPAAPPAPIDGPESIAELLTPMLQQQPDDLVLIGRNARYTTQALEKEVLRAARVLWSLGVRPGDRIAASLPNDGPIVVAFLAAMRLGAIWVGVNRALAPPEKAYMLRDCETSVLLSDPAVAEGLATELPALADLRHVVLVDPGGTEDEWGPLVAAAAADPLGVVIDRMYPAAIAYTSGTTGFPKGAVHTQHNLLLPGAVHRSRGPGAGGVQGVALPLTILNLMVLGPLLAYQSNMALVAMDRVDSLGMAEWIAAERITTFAAVPAMVHDLLTHPEVTDEMLASLDSIGVGGANMPESFRTLYRNRFGRRVGTGYGLTEAPTTVTAEDPAAPEIPGTCGTALAHVRIHILGPNDRELPVGEAGEVCVGPADVGPFADAYRPMLGYWNRAEESAKALHGGLLHTGDIGVVDADGNLFIKDRKNDLIIRGGSNVYPAEVERVLHQEPRVAACAVIGQPDERLGERVIAFVEPVPGSAPSAEELLELCRSQLARYKVPDRVVFVDTFPRTPMGKIRKTLLRPEAQGAPHA